MFGCLIHTDAACKCSHLAIQWLPFVGKQILKADSKLSAGHVDTGLCCRFETLMNFASGGGLLVPMATVGMKNLLATFIDSGGVESVCRKSSMCVLVCTGSCDMCTGSCDMCTGSCDVCTGSCDMCTGSCDVCTGSCDMFTGSCDVCTGSCDMCTG